MTIRGRGGILAGVLATTMVACSGAAVTTTAGGAQPAPAQPAAVPAAQAPPPAPVAITAKPVVEITSCQQRVASKAVVVGGLLGTRNKTGSVRGGFGLRKRSPGSTIGTGYGMGPGGGGTGWGLIGTGRYGHGPAASPARITRGKVTVHGALDRNIVRRYVRRWHATMVGCYNKFYGAGKTRPTGRARLSFVVDSTGQVTKAKLKGMPLALRKCITSYIMRARLPKPRSGSARVEQPLTFSWHPTGIGVGYGGRGSSRRSPVVQVRAGSPSIVGDLSLAIVRRYLRRRQNRIKYCYEKQLLVSPKLRGKVIVKFTISPTGAARSVRASGLHRKVDRCVASVIKSIVFPRPKGGGVARVKIPYVFGPAGSTPPRPSLPSVSTRPRPTDGKMGRRESTREAGRYARRAPTPPVTISAKPRLHDLPWGRCKALPPPPVMVDATAKITSCYAASLKKSPALAGNLRLQYATDRQGHVVVHAAATGLADPALTKCVETALVGAKISSTVGAAHAHNGVCTVSLRNAAAPAKAPTRIDITQAAVKLGSITLAPTRRIVLGDYSRSVVNTLRDGLVRAQLGNHGAVEVHVDPGVDIKAVDLVIQAVRSHGDHVVHLAVASGPAPQQAALVALSPAHALCRGGNWSARVGLGTQSLRIHRPRDVSIHMRSYKLLNAKTRRSLLGKLANKSRWHVAVTVDQGLTYRMLALILAELDRSGVREISYSPAAL